MAKSDPKQKSQSAKSREAAPNLGADESEEAFKTALKHVVRAARPKDGKKPKPGMSGRD